MGYIPYCRPVASSRESILYLYLFLLSDPQASTSTRCDAPRWSWRGNKGRYDCIHHSIPASCIDEGCPDDDTSRALYAHSFARS